jgi:hypothetical protein
MGPHVRNLPPSIGRRPLIKFQPFPQTAPQLAANFIPSPKFAMERSGHGSAGDDGSLHRFPDPPPPANGIGIQMLSPFHDFFLRIPFHDFCWMCFCPSTISFMENTIFPPQRKRIFGTQGSFLQFGVECSLRDLMVPRENWGLLWLKNGLFVFFF